jgi:hypothetical protein
LTPQDLALDPADPAPEQSLTVQNSPSSSKDPEVVRLSHLLADLIRQRDPKAKLNPDSDRWLNETRLLIKDRDGDTKEVEDVLRWAQADDFWRANILSPAKLREKFTQLEIKRNQPANGRGHARVSNTGDLSRFRDLGE